MKIHRSKQSDIHDFRAFWDSAADYQRARRLPVWPAFPEERINDEMRAGLHFSARMPDGVVAGYFSVALSDELIWGAEEQGDAIYIHRVCVNPERKGNNLAASILEWARGYAPSLGRKFIRMDTWADNKRLVNFYVDCGFHYIGDRQLGDVPELEPHYSNIKLALFQNSA
ncbi:MAG: GNAT family N-acetyltransferase [Gemmatimonadaceae bacterium]